MRYPLNILYCFALLSLTVFLSACEKVIEVDLNEANPQLVLEAVFVKGGPVFKVRATLTRSYFNPDSVEVVDDADVVLENGAQSWNLLFSDGHFQDSIVNASEKRYDLSFEWKGTAYQATSYLPSEVQNIELKYEAVASSFGGGFGQQVEQDTSYSLTVYFDDSIGEDNYYLVTYEVNGLPEDESELQLLSDRNGDGTRFQIPVQFGRKLFAGGDTVKVFVKSFDRATYDYYLGLAEVVSSSGSPIGGSVAPGNPSSNWDGNILGYFSVQAWADETIVLP